MKLLEVNEYIEDYDSTVVFFIEEGVYKYNTHLFKSNVFKDYYFNHGKLTRVFKS